MENLIETEYNSNIAVIIRLNNLLDDCVNYSRECRIFGPNPIYLNAWKGTLLSFYTEISSKLNKKEKKVIKLLWVLLQQQKNLIIVNKTEEGIKKTINRKVFNRRFNIQHQIEIRLRKYADKKGLLMKDKQTMDDEPQEW